MEMEQENVENKYWILHFFPLKKNDKWRCQWPNFVLWEETEQLGIEEAQGCHLHTERGNPATSNSKFV